MIRPPLLALAVAFTLAACAEGAAPPTALAPGSPVLAKGGATVARSEVGFTIPAGTCGMTTNVTGTGVFQSVARVLENGGGKVRFAFNETAHGTATGEDGSTYVFSYTANYEVVEVLDPSGLPVVIDIVDHFNLLGQHGAPDSKVYFHGQFQYDGTLPLTPVGTPTVRGDLACDFF